MFVLLHNVEKRLLQVLVLYRGVATGDVMYILISITLMIMIRVIQRADIVVPKSTDMCRNWYIQSYFVNTFEWKRKSNVDVASSLEILIVVLLWALLLILRQFSGGSIFTYKFFDTCLYFLSLFFEKQNRWYQSFLLGSELFEKLCHRVMRWSWWWRTILETKSKQWQW